MDTGYGFGIRAKENGRERAEVEAGLADRSQVNVSLGLRPSKSKVQSSHVESDVGAIRVNFG